VVVAVCDVHAFAGSPCGERAVHEQDVILGLVEGAEASSVDVAPVCFGEVLDERPPERHV